MNRREDVEETSIKYYSTSASPNLLFLKIVYFGLEVFSKMRNTFNIDTLIRTNRMGERAYRYTVKPREAAFRTSVSFSIRSLSNSSVKT